MNQLAKDIAFSIWVGMLIPGLLLNGAAAVWNRAVEVTEGNSLPQMQTVSLPVRVRTGEGQVTEGNLEDYLVGVVLAEMPASFEEEALKAQAVVARTYARKAWQTGGKHGDGSVCTSPDCCQGWREEADYLHAGGRTEDVQKIREAVYATSGQVLMYGKELIEATYFSCSGGRTEDAVAVWGTDFPYLQAVDSPGEESSAYYTDRISFRPEVLEQRLGVRLAGNSGEWIKDIRYTDGGGVETLVVGGTVFSGTELRARLGLRSTAFSVTAGAGEILFETRGYGHRVGMSQYGADAMAESGHTYEEILAHYYQGAELTMVEEN